MALHRIAAEEKARELFKEAEALTADHSTTVETHEKYTVFQQVVNIVDQVIGVMQNWAKARQLRLEIYRDWIATAIQNDDLGLAERLGRRGRRSRSSS